MQATASVGLLTWFWLAILGGANGLPAGGPPLPLDLQLSVIAPEDCLLYVSHSGFGEPDSGSDHPTEKLYAEPQVQRFADELAKQFQAIVQRGLGTGRSEQTLVDEGPRLLSMLVSRPSALYVEEIEFRGKQVEVEAAFVVHAGDQFPAARTAITRLLGVAAKKGVKIGEEELGGLDWKRIEVQPDAPVIRIGYYEQYVIVAIGEKTPGKLAERSAGSPPEWLESLRREHPVDREISVSYVNIKGLAERIREVARDAEGWAAAGKLGLGAIEELHTISGFDANGCVSHSHLATGGQRQGIFSLLPYKPLSKRDLESIPADALIAAACRVDLDEVFDEAVRLARNFEPQAEEKIESVIRKVESDLGVDVHDDLLHALGDVWIAYVPPGDLMSSWLGTAAAVRVKDQVRLTEAIEKLVDAARRDARNGNAGNIDIRESTSGGRTIYWVEFVDQSLPVAPAWCVSDGWLVFGLLPQTIHAVLDRDDQSSLADVERVKTALDQSGGPTILAYQDTPRLVQSVYPWIQMGVQAISSPLKREGIEIDVTALPSASVIVKHLRPAVSTLTHRSDGYHGTAYTSVASGGNLVTAAPVMAALLVPAITEARHAARTMQETNHMKQIALAILNYESANGHLPTNVYDEQGNALLSWRVQVLPYMEEIQRYEQIRMDEPWDSPHNRQAGAETPITYQSINEPTAPGKTRMLALAGDETLWPGRQEVKFRDIRDGTSNTLMVVQVNPQAAVDWMKPEDLNFNPQDPFAKLQHPSAQFLVAFCDGFVRQLSLGIGADMMRALATRAGGEVIEREKLDVPAQPRGR